LQIIDDNGTRSDQKNQSSASASVCVLASMQERTVQTNTVNTSS